jgi:glycosyltransferase involved in cell wall biosynthesis
VTARVGWVVADTLSRRWRPWRSLPAAVKMRVANTARWLNANVPGMRNEPYRRGRRYDVVVFFKTMDAEAQEEARRIQAYGGKVVFDANVNYYEIWGAYDVEGTRPTEEQQRDAVAMTGLADSVVADSSYLLERVRIHNESATWIPDNVDLARYGRARDDRGSPVRVAWSGIAKKALPLLDVRDALAELRGAELVVVSDAEPDVLRELREVIPCRFVRFSERRYARTLRECDVIISPKRLVNAYELAHTEWKITLGMAVGLPAVASPQQSYVEAISDRGGGIVAGSAEEWIGALTRLAGDAGLRRELGARARETVARRYAVPVVSRRYGDFLQALV